MPYRESGSLFALVALGALLGGAEWRSRAVSRGFAAPGSAFTLALLRIAVFAGLLRFASSACGPIFATACVLGIVGLFTRASAWIVVALGLQFGSIGGPLLWAAALLAVTPCADVLALDAVSDAWRRADTRNTAPPAPSPIYGAPLKMLGLFFGLGLCAWSFSGSALRGSLLLPMSFFDLAKGLRWLGRRLFPKPLAIVNDGDCGFCRRAVATLRTLDLLERIDWVASTDSERVRALGLERVADGEDLEHFTAVAEGGMVTGYDAYLRLVARIPFFWPALPLLALPPVVALGRATYTRVEASRPNINPEPLASRPAPTTLGVWIVGFGVAAIVVVRLLYDL